MNLNENIAESEDIDDKIKNRLLKYYLCWFAKRDESTVSLVNYLFENRNDLAYHRELINKIGVGRHDQIASFLKACLKNGFSSVEIGKFIEIHKDLFFNSQDKGFIVNVNGGQPYTIPAHQKDKNFAICRFLLLILDISQDKNFSNSVQKPTIDYILELAENITDYKWRCRFKMAAISYFLPDDNEYIKSHLSSVMSDMKKLFENELSDDNHEIDMKYKFEIKYMILDMLTAKRNLVRKDIANFNVGKNSNFTCAFDPWTLPVEKVNINETQTQYKFVKYKPYIYYHDCLPDDVAIRRDNLLNGSFKDQSTQDSFVIVNDRNEIDESEHESEIDNVPSFVKDDIKNSKNLDDGINFVDDDADDDDIKELFLIWSDDNYSQEGQSDGLNNILDFAADYIKKLVDNGDEFLNWFTQLLFFDVRNLFSDKVLLKKIDELLNDHEHNQNDYKIFTLVLALLQNNNDGLHFPSSFTIAEQFANEANKMVLQKKLNTEMKFKLLNFVRKYKRYVNLNKFDTFYKKLYKVLFNDGNTRWKIENRLLKFYKNRFQVNSESSSQLVDCLFNQRYDLADHQELINALFIGKHNQIVEFIKNGLENHFSAQAISEFIINNEGMFFDGTEQIYSVKINNRKIINIKLIDSKSSRIMKFLLLILDISQDKNFRNPKQELTIDYIVELAKNINDHKDRYKFKILALSYFLPDRNRWFDENKQLHEIDLSQYMIDIKKLFADEFSKENQDIDEKERLEIKRVAIDMLTAYRNLIRRNASDLNLGDGSYFKKYCSCAKDGVTNCSYYYLYHDVYEGACFFSQSKVIDDIFDFFEDDIKKSISDKDANNNFFKSNGLLFSHIRRLFGETLLLQKISELIKDNQNGQNDYKIFVLIFALIQNSKSPEFCIDKSIADESKFIDNSYGSYYHNDILKYLTDNLYPELKFKLLFFFYKQLVHVRKNNGKNDVYIDDKLLSEQDKLANIFYPNFHEYICDFCAHYKKDKLDDRIDPVAFGSFAWRIFVNNHNNAYNKHEVLENMLQCVSDQILKDNKAVNPFLYEFLGNMLDRYVYLIKQSEYFRNESVIIFDCFLSLIEKDKNMSAKDKKDINDFVIMLFNPDNLRLYLENRQFVEYLARIIKNDQLNFYLPSQKKYFFVYIKECLKSVINNDSSQDFLTQYKNKKNEPALLENQISDLNSRINDYKKFYLFKWVPVLGWVACVVLYFVKIKPMENELNTLQTQHDNAKNIIADMENLGCKNIEDFINSKDDYNKDTQNSVSEIVENKEKNILNKPPLDNQGIVK